MKQAILRLPDIKSRTGLSRTEIYRRQALGKFPKSIKLGVRSVGWLETDISKWIEERIRVSRRKEKESTS